MTPNDPTTKPAPPAHEAAERRDWTAYFDRTAGMPPRETLITALDAFGDIDPDDPPLAADLGCGTGRDTVELLRRGWRVWAQDSNSEGLARLRASPVGASAIKVGLLEIHDADFAQVTPPRCSLVNASFSVPFCPPADFEAFWARVHDAIEPGGRFAGQFFGDRDDWAILEDRTHLTRAHVLELFSDYVLESFREEDRPSRHEGEAHKHWHVMHVVARKRGAS